MNVTYLLPLKRSAGTACCDLAAYLQSVARFMPVIVVDGSSDREFDALDALLPWNVQHVRVDPRIAARNGKVAGVCSGLPLVRTGGIIIADDDVRYSERGLTRIAERLERASVVRPQNYFDPLPWHAVLDTGRTLIARAFGDDWPGTLAVRTDVLRRTGGYAGDVLFENLELVRTVVAAGGVAAVAIDCYVARRPPSTQHYFHQRIRQAYDEFARPPYLLGELALAPLAFLALFRLGPAGIAGIVFAIIVLAEYGRRRAGGARYFPVRAALLAPVWVLERATTIWIALGMRIVRGGVRYGDGILDKAANSRAVLRRRFAA